MSNNLLLQFADAKQLVLQEAQSVNYHRYESVALTDAVNRIVAKSILSPINIPAFDNSAMDGYAIRLKDLAVSTTLPVAHTIYAGDNCDDMIWPPNTCLRIMTGAPVPNDADSVVMQEETEKRNNKIIFSNNVKKNQHIRRIGDDIKIGEKLVFAGERLTIPKLSMLATLGLSEIKVYKPLKVAIFSTGNELLPLGSEITSPGSIYDSNRFTLHLMLKALGCEVIDLGIVKDNQQEITKKLKRAARLAHIIITSGGVSVGDADLTKNALEEVGQIKFCKIAMKPGKPFAFGKINNAIFCGLPGNPVSTLVTFYQLVRPLIFTIYGNESELNAPLISVKTSTDLKKSVGRVDFQRGYLHTTEGGSLMVESTGEQGSHMTSSFSQANCFIVLEKNRANVMAGEWVNIQFFDPFLL